jgi:glutamine synthetase
MALSNVRQEAVRAIASANHKLNRVDFKTTHVKDLYASNVFNEEVQRQRLPKTAFRRSREHSPRRTAGPNAADAIAAAMKDWAIERGATHFTHLFQPSDRDHRREARQLLVTQRRGGRSRSLAAGS